MIGKLLLIALLALILWAALPATDAFTDADATPLSTHNANWVYAVGSFTINSNQVSNSGAAENLARWSGDSFAANQYSQVVVAAIAGVGYTGMAVRIDTGGAVTAYTAAWSAASGGITYISKKVAGTNTDLGSVAVCPSVSDVMRLEVVGTSVTLKKNGAAFIGPITDGDIASGAAGVYGYGASTNMLDDWEAGDITASARRRVVISQ